MHYLQSLEWFAMISLLVTQTSGEGTGWSWLKGEDAKSPTNDNDNQYNNQAFMAANSAGSSQNAQYGNSQNKYYGGAGKAQGQLGGAQNFQPVYIQQSGQQGYGGSSQNDGTYPRVQSQYGQGVQNSQVYTGNNQVDQAQQGQYIGSHNTYHHQSNPHHYQHVASPPSAPSYQTGGYVYNTHGQHQDVAAVQQYPSNQQNDVVTYHVSGSRVLPVGAVNVHVQKASNQETINDQQNTDQIFYGNPPGSPSAPDSTKKTGKKPLNPWFSETPAPPAPLSPADERYKQQKLSQMKDKFVQDNEYLQKIGAHASKNMASLDHAYETRDSLTGNSKRTPSGTVITVGHHNMQAPASQQTQFVPDRTFDRPPPNYYAGKIEANPNFQFAKPEERPLWIQNVQNQILQQHGQQRSLTLEEEEKRAGEMYLQQLQQYNSCESWHLRRNKIFAAVLSLISLLIASKLWY